MYSNIAMREKETKAPLKLYASIRRAFFYSQTCHFPNLSKLLHDRTHCSCVHLVKPRTRRTLPSACSILASLRHPATNAATLTSSAHRRLHVERQAVIRNTLKRPWRQIVPATQRRTPDLHHGLRHPPLHPEYGTFFHRFAPLFPSALHAFYAFQTPAIYPARSTASACWR
jgi:hypothetical protein